MSRPRITKRITIFLLASLLTSPSVLAQDFQAHLVDEVKISDSGMYLDGSSVTEPPKAPTTGK